MLRPFTAEEDRDIFAARTEDIRLAGDGTQVPAGDLGDEIRGALARFAAEEAAWLVAEVGSTKVGMVFGELADGEVDAVTFTSAHRATPPARPRPKDLVLDTKDLLAKARAPSRLPVAASRTSGAK